MGLLWILISKGCSLSIPTHFETSFFYLNVLTMHTWWSQIVTCSILYKIYIYGCIWYPFTCSKKNETETNFYHFLRYLPDFYGDLFIDRNFSIYAHTYILWNDTNNQLVDHSDSLLITFRILIIAKFIKYIKFYLTFMLKKENIKLNQFKEFIFKL